jgi:leucyl aminopeptidase
VKVRLDPREPDSVPADATVGAIAEPTSSDNFPETLSRFDAEVGGAIRRAWEAKELRGHRREVTVFHRPNAPGRIVIAGLGPLPVTLDSVRSASAWVVRQLRGRGVRSAAFGLPAFGAAELGEAAALRALVEGAVLGGYQFVQFRAESDPGVQEVVVATGPSPPSPPASLEPGLAATLQTLESVVWTRDVANQPPNIATPEWLASQARAMGGELGLKVTVLDEKELAQLGCGGLLAVGSGSRHPPRLIILEHAGDGTTDRTVAVVGKGITFDSGGISIKPSAGMAEMKFDKSGACAVLGILRNAAVRKLPVHLVGLLACAENLPGGGAYRPGDLVRTYGGLTIEVLDTDAEGRVVLSDALSYAVDRYHPTELIDLATLTGAAVVALGENVAAVVGNHEPLERSLVEAGARTGETVWRLPLTDPHREMVKSDVADVRNVVEPRIAGCLIGAAFLERFVGKTPWAHLDIAGPAYSRLATLKYNPTYHPLGATAFGVRLLAELLSPSTDRA